MNIGWLIGLASSSLLLFLAYFFLSIGNYKRRFNIDFDIRNHFPYEFNFESKFTDNILGNSALILSGGFSIALFACSAVYKNNNGMLFVALIAGVSLTIMFLVINFIPLKFLKTHLVFSILLFVASFITPAAIGMTAFRDYQEYSSVGSLILFIIAAIVALFNFALVMNPKLTLNIRMEVATDEKGNEYYIRPKFIVLAFSQWMMIFTLFISQILLLILLILI